jgi:hypothetical protein
MTWKRFSYVRQRVLTSSALDAYLKMKRLRRRFDDEKRVRAKQDGPAIFVLRIIEPASESFHPWMYNSKDA